MIRGFPRLLLIVILAASVVAIIQWDDPGNEAGPEPAGELQDPVDFDSLPPEQRETFRAQLQQAKDLFAEKRIFACLEEIDKLHAIFDRNPATHNLQGACYVEFRSFEKARIAFAKAEKFSPGHFNVRFNLAEIEFVSKDFPETLKQFEALLEEAKTNPAGLQMLPLIKFKVLLGRLKGHDPTGAAEVIADCDLLDDSPLFCYGKAALADHAGNDREAGEWIARASRIFPDPASRWIWDDTLFEYGYAPTLKASFRNGTISKPTK